MLNGLETVGDSRVTLGAGLGENKTMKICRGFFGRGVFLGALFVLGSLIVASPAFAQRVAAPQFGLMNDDSSVGDAELAGAQNQSPAAASQNPAAPAACPPAAAPSDQKPAPCPPADASKAADQTKTDQNAKPDAAATSKDRLFYAMPNFLTLESTEHVPPLTAGQKFKAVARGSFDPFQFAWYGLLSGINEANGSEPGYGNGFQGYAKRYGASFADGTIENFMVGAVMASALRQDPRFYQKSDGTFMHRLGYAVSRIIITRGDSGRSQFNASEIFGSAIAAGVSTYSYHPHADKTLDNTLSVWGTQVGYDTITTVIKEFWPDIRRKFSKKTKTDGDLQ
jgi:hypothetical protein